MPENTAAPKSPPINAHLQFGLNHALRLAAESGNPGSVKELLALGADPEGPTREGAQSEYSERAALAFACLSGDPECVRLLLAAGASPARRYQESSAENEQDPYVYPIDYLAHKLDCEPGLRALEALLAADPRLLTLRPTLGQKILISAIQGEKRERHPGVSREVARVLINAGASAKALPPARGRDGLEQRRFSPLGICAQSGSAAMARLLFEFGADPNEGAGQELAPFHMACDRHNAPMIEAFLEAGANPNMPDGCGLGPLHTASASYSDKPEVELAIRALVAGGADVNAKGAKESGAVFPLLTAAFNGNHIAAHTLISLGADMLAESLWYENSAHRIDEIRRLDDVLTSEYEIDPHWTPLCARLRSERLAQSEKAVLESALPNAKPARARKM